MHQRCCSSRVAFGPAVNNVVPGSCTCSCCSVVYYNVVSIRESDLEGDARTRIIYYFTVVGNGGRDSISQSAVNYYVCVDIYKKKIKITRQTSKYRFITIYSYRITFVLYGPVTRYNRDVHYSVLR